MGLLHSFKKLFADPKHVTTIDELEAGQIIVDGVVKLGEAGPLLSPIKGQPCVAFFYSASYRTPGRSSQPTDRPLRNVEGFQPFELELDGGRIDAVPQTAGGFSRDDHQALVNTGYQDFRAAEEIVGPRARVRLRGSLKRRGDGWVMTYRRIEVLKKGEAAAKRLGTKVGKRKR